MNISENGNLPEFYSLEDIAKLFKIHRVTAGKLLKTEGFPCVVIGRSYRIPRLLFNKWLVNHLFDTIVLSDNTECSFGADGE